MAPKVANAAAEFRQEAAEARDLASMLKDSASVADLLNYACALESDAAEWEGGSASGVVKQLQRETRGPRQMPLKRASSPRHWKMSARPPIC